MANSSDELQEVLRGGAAMALRSLRERSVVVAAPIGATVHDEVWRCRARLSLIPDQVALTECMTDILTVMADTSGRVKTKLVWQLLELAGKIHGRSTTKMALAKMVATGLLVSHRRGGSGYELPGEEYPLFGRSQGRAG